MVQVDTDEVLVFVNPALPLQLRKTIVHRLFIPRALPCVIFPSEHLAAVNPSSDRKDPPLTTTTTTATTAA